MNVLPPSPLLLQRWLCVNWDDGHPLATCPQLPAQPSFRQATGRSGSSLFWGHWAVCSTAKPTLCLIAAPAVHGENLLVMSGFAAEGKICNAKATWHHCCGARELWPGVCLRKNHQACKIKCWPLSHTLLTKTKRAVFCGQYLWETCGLFCYCQWLSAKAGPGLEKKIHWKDWCVWNAQA